MVRTVRGTAKIKKIKKQFRHSSVTATMYTTDIFIPLLQILATNEVRRQFSSLSSKLDYCPYETVLLHNYTTGPPAENKPPHRVQRENWNDVRRTVGLTILKERKKFFQFSVICKNRSYRTLKIALELSVGSNREVILGCVWDHITEAYLVRVIPSAGLHEIIQQPVLFAFCGLLCREILIFLKVVCQ